MVHKLILRRYLFVRRCAFSARDNVLRYEPKKSIGADHEMPCDDSYLRTRHDKVRTSKRISGSLLQFCRQGEIDKSRCPQCPFLLGTAFFSYFFLVVKMAFCESQPCCFSHIEVPKTSRYLLVFIRDSPKTSLVSSYWWSQKFSNKPFPRNIAIRVESHLHNVFCDFRNTMFFLTTIMFSLCTCIFTKLLCSQNPFFWKTLCACDKSLPHV
jgi:hypothetical protein